MKKKYLAGALLCVLGLLTGCGGKTEARIIKAVDLQGTVTYTREKKEEAVYCNMNFQNGDEVKTGQESNLMMQLDSDKYVYMYADTRISLDCSGDETNGKTYINLESGEISNDIENKLTKDSQYEVHTSNATIGVRGTKFYVKYAGEKTIVYCEEGSVGIKADNNEIFIEPGQGAIVSDGTVAYAAREEVADELLLDMDSQNSESDDAPMAEDAVAPGETTTPNDIALPEKIDDVWIKYDYSAQDGYIRVKGDVPGPVGIDNAIENLETGTRDALELGVTSTGAGYKITEHYENWIMVSAERLEDGELKYFLTYEYDGEKYVSYTVLDAAGNKERIDFTEWDENGRPIRGHGGTIE